MEQANQIVCPENTYANFSISTAREQLIVEVHHRSGVPFMSFRGRILNAGVGHLVRDSQQN